MTRAWLIILIILLPLIQAGCTLLLVGGAGAGGYYVGKDKRSVGEITEDASITAGVKSKLIRDDKIHAMEIDVDTYRGVVTLSGHVEKQELAARSVALAASVSGVKTVRSNLKIIP